MMTLERLGILNQLQTELDTHRDSLNYYRDHHNTSLALLEAGTVTGLERALFIVRNLIHSEAEREKLQRLVTYS